MMTTSIEQPGTATAPPVAPTTAIRQTLDATVPRLTATLRAVADGSLPLQRMRWRTGELGAHIAQTATVFTQAVRGEVTAYGEDGTFSAEVDQKLVDELPERDPARLADLIEERYAGLKEASDGRPDDELLPRFQGYSIAGLHAVWVLDLSVHGHQIGAAAGRPFAVDNAAMRLALSTVLPFAFHPDGARGLRATYAMHIKGTEPIVYSVDDGTIRVQGNKAAVDCHLGVDPTAFLLVTLGVMPQWQAILSGKMRAWGRRPWLSARMSKMFPQVPHGGVARRGTQRDISLAELVEAVRQRVARLRR
jgi:hypothetical protein